MLNNPQQRKALVLSLLMVMLAQTAYIGAMQGWSYPTELDEPSPQGRSAALETLFPDLDLRLFVDPSNSSSYSGSGTTLVDLSSYDHNGTIDGATWDANRTRFTYDGSCTTGSVANFDCDEINFGESNDHDPDSGGDWSVSTWFNASTIQQSVIVGKVDDGGTSVDVGWMIRMNTDGVRVDVGTTTNSSAAWTPPESVATNRWYHVVLVADKGTSLAMFIDGAEVKNISLASSGDLRNTANGVSIGSYNAGEYSQPFDGQIGAVMAYADALNLTAVNQLYNASKGVYSNTTSLSYAPQNMTLEKGTTMTTNTPSVSGGTITSWEINATLPAGLNFGTSNGTIWGIPTVLQTTATTYTIWANNSGVSSSFTITLTINDAAPGPFEYNPENNTWANNTEVHLAPNFVNITTGNGTTWTVSSTIFTPYPSGWDGICFAEEVDGVLYLSGSNGLYGYGLQNHTIWHVSTISMPGCWRGSGMFAPTVLALSHSVGDTLFFSATGSNGTELYAYNTVNTTTWLVADINQGTGSSAPGVSFFQEAGDVFLFSADDGSSGTELWAHDTSNGTTWRVADINSGAGSSSLTNKDVQAMIGDVVLFRATDGSSQELWAYNLTNTTVWQAANLSSGVASPWGINGASWQLITVGDVAYFGAIVPNSAASEDRELHAYNVTNQTAWTVTDVNTNTTTGAKSHSLFLLNDVLYFKARVGLDDGYSCVAHAPANATTWVKNDGFKCPADFGTSTKKVWIGGILYSGNSAYNPDNQSTWYVINSTRTGGITTYTYVAVGDVLYFSGGLDGAGNNRRSLWAHDTTNGTTWFVEGSNTTTQNYPTPQFIHSFGNTALFQHAVMSSVSLMAVQAAEINSLVNTGGPVTSYAINASLPSGLSFGTNNGTIYGTPTELWTQTSYMVWANNSGGSSVAYLNITVVDQLPTSINYLPENMTFTNNTAVTPNMPTVTGAGEITSWAINASLPSGLSFGTNNGTIYGTPTELWYQTAYMVWANNSGGSVLAYFNLTVVDHVPTVSYSTTNLTLYNNTTSNALPLVPIVTGQGEITLWGLNTSLPSGLSFNNNNGTIWGTPTELWPTTAYRLAALNSGGTTYAYFNLTVLHQAPMFTYPSYNLTLVNNTAMTSLATTITGGDITSWEISPSIPTGMFLGSVYGTIWGTPTVVQNQTMYTVWGNNSGGSHAVYLNITIYDPGVTLDYNPENLTLTRGVAMSDLSPIYSGIVDNWTFEPALPAGLTFTNGVIAGTPTVNMTATMYTVWANNSGGSSNHTINITVLEPMVILDYNPENLTLIRGVQMATLFPSLSGGVPSNWSISPSLPAGLNFSDGVISGTPTVNMTATMYTVWANNTGGDVSHTINITILEPSGNLSYSPENITLTRGVAMSTLHPTYSGGAVENWSIHPALPAGLNFSNGIISGTPTVNMTTSMFTVYANNTGGSAAATINITILEPVVDLFYNPNNLTLMRGTTMMPLVPTISGGNVSEWSLVGVLPEGLNFSNGVFSGTPLVNMTQTPYLVYANTTGGSAIAWINITVLEPAVDLSYNPYNITLTRNVTMNPLSPTVSGGNVSNWSIFPELPAGLNFTNGTISGTPEVNMTTTMFTVWANTSGGATSTTVNITVVEPQVDFLYSPNAIVLTRNETMNATSPVFGNDALAEEWGISPALPEGLNFTNGTISGTPLVNMTATVFTIYANNTGGTAVAYLTITVLEPVATVLYLPENITLTRGEDNASLVPILGGGMVASWSISPELPDGMVFDNGTITGVPLVNMTNTTFTVMALNSGGMAFAFLNLTVVEPAAILAFNESFVVTRGEDLLNQTVNNTGGAVASWAIEPALPDGVTIVDGWLYGVAQVNLTETVFTLWANNSGGSVNLTFTLEVFEPVANLSYPVGDITLIRGSSRSNLRPLLEGGVPETWEIEPALPEGMRLVNGYVIGVPMGMIETTTFTVWANNSGGSASATFTLTVNQPTYLARYPVTRVVLEVNETMTPIFPLYYFGSAQQPDWAISPELPEGLVFFDGRISGTPTVAWNETNYSVTVTGDMVPVELFIIIEVRGEPDLVVENIRNATEEQVFSLPDLTPEDDSFDMYWVCFPLLLLVTLMGVAAINNFLALTAKDEEDEDEEGPENEGKSSD